jgi:hypothetical protein
MIRVHDCPLSWRCERYESNQFTTCKLAIRKPECDFGFVIRSSRMISALLQTRVNGNYGVFVAIWCFRDNGRHGVSLNTHTCGVGTDGLDIWWQGTFHQVWKRAWKRSVAGPGLVLDQSFFRAYEHLLRRWATNLFLPVLVPCRFCFEWLNVC